MKPSKIYNALGLMSGTSRDGVDAALMRTDGESFVECGAALTLPYDEEFRERLRRVVGRVPAEAPELAASVTREITFIHAEAVRRLLTAGGAGPSSIDVIGFHGHTILHRPRSGITVQIGDGDLLAGLTGIEVIDDFRSSDVAAGGQGAPLVPLYHAALASKLPRPIAVLNVGGVANVTWVGRGGELLAFDTGPGNALIDDWVRFQTGRALDEGGRIAATGKVNENALERLISDPYFDAPPPKSLDRDHFDIAPLQGLSAEDGAATLTRFTARAVARAIPFLPDPPLRWLVAGGGRHNAALMAALGKELGTSVGPVETVGWDGDALEAQAFAYLAVRSLKGLPLSLPSTTGVKQPQTGGRRHRPKTAAAL